jgi:hypothetical protein
MAMPLAAAPYRASGLVQWHFSDLAIMVGSVRSLSAKADMTATRHYF